MASTFHQRTSNGRRDDSRSRFRVGITASLGTFALALFTGPALAGRAGTIQFNIPAQPLSSGVIEFSRQANVQVLTAGSRLQGLNTRGVNGTYSVTAGIKHLLAGTGFGYFLIGNDTISLIPPPGRKVTLDGPKTTPLRTRIQGKAGTASKPRSTYLQAKQASQKGTEPPALQEIVVTAQKYRQRAFDVPISLQVISGQELQQHGITNLTNLQYDVPGLVMRNDGYQHAIYLRGVGDSLGNGALVGQYINDADITANGYISGTDGFASGDNGLYDLKRVEVLKGPQGTLYGDGSMGGVIRYITNEPVLDRLQMNADVAALFTECVFRRL